MQEGQSRSPSKHTGKGTILAVLSYSKLNQGLELH